MIFLVIILVLFIIYFRLYLYLFPKHRLIILMYHKVEKEAEDELTVSVENLEKQFKYLREKKYRSLFFKDIQSESRKKIIITFDDGYYNNYEFLPALLEKYDLKAIIFISTGFIENGYHENKMMSFEDLKNLNPNFFEIALHSHLHQNFRTLNIREIEKDLIANMQILESHQINYSKIVAYPYGKYAKNKENQNLLFYTLKKLGIDFAVRIGNKINYFPNAQPYELCRIDIKGGDSLQKFKIKLILGKLKFF
ncbi:polysaccharide deacetylase family protein [Chryseobacterium gotjawalense]|uniref:Polysaccharide deacetylase family protein n=1 Tax=Chryseobacterium gotjawalense TaxID=3042315 RepID=A0ABY8RBN2_9FLAO|nr:polysaccharide deacetylase family protein [Chryseobacterium sp. wdc7]WHF51231.1 polysaccharide deacetylase family protein [Chryseobacterium sp. wdc7]